MMRMVCLVWAILASVIPITHAITVISPSSLNSTVIYTNIFTRHLGLQDSAQITALSADLSIYRWEEGCSFGNGDAPGVMGKIWIAKQFECDPGTLLERVGALDPIAIVYTQDDPFVDPSFCTGCRFGESNLQIPFLAIYKQDLLDSGVLDAITSGTNVTVTLTLDRNKFAELHDDPGFIFFWRVFAPLLNLIAMAFAIRNLHGHWRRPPGPGQMGSAQPQPREQRSALGRRVIALIRTIPNRNSFQVLKEKTFSRKYDFSISTVPRVALFVELVACLLRLVLCASDPPYNAEGVFTYTTYTFLYTITYPMHLISHGLVVWFYRRLYVALNMKQYHWLGHLVDPHANIEKIILAFFCLVVLLIELLFDIVRGVGWGNADVIVYQTVAYTAFEICIQVIQVVMVVQVLRLLGDSDPIFKHRPSNTRRFISYSTRWMAVGCFWGLIILFSLLLNITLNYTPNNFFVISACTLVGLTGASMAQIIALTPVRRSTAHPEQTEFSRSRSVEVDPSGTHSPSPLARIDPGEGESGVKEGFWGGVRMSLCCFKQDGEADESTKTLKVEHGNLAPSPQDGDGL